MNVEKKQICDLSPKESSILRKNQIFKKFNHDTVERFINKSKKITYKKGKIICSELSQSEKIYFILEGEISVEFILDRSNTQLTIGLGDFVCLDRFIQDENPIATATIVAKLDLVLLVWNASDWKEIAQEDTAIGYVLSRAVAKTLLKRIKLWQTYLLNNASWGIE